MTALQNENCHMGTPCHHPMSPSHITTSMPMSPSHVTIPAPQHCLHRACLIHVLHVVPGDMGVQWDAHVTTFLPCHHVLCHIRHIQSSLTENLESTRRRSFCARQPIRIYILRIFELSDHFQDDSTDCKQCNPLIRLDRLETHFGPPAGLNYKIQ
jgi:hypothetical protein